MEYRNKVDRLFGLIANWKDISVQKNYNWKKKLVDLIGPKINARTADTVGNWISRNNIPDKRINDILSLNPPESIKNLCEELIKDNAERRKQRRESRKTLKDIEGYEVENKIAPTSIFLDFKNPQKIQNILSWLLEIDSLDPEYLDWIEYQVLKKHLALIHEKFGKKKSIKN